MTLKISRDQSEYLIFFHFKHFMRHSYHYHTLTDGSSVVFGLGFRIYGLSALIINLLHQLHQTPQTPVLFIEAYTKSLIGYLHLYDAVPLCPQLFAINGQFDIHGSD